MNSLSHTESPSALSSLLSYKQITNDYQITGKKEKNQQKATNTETTEIICAGKNCFLSPPFIYQLKKGITFMKQTGSTKDHSENQEELLEIKSTAEKTQ